MRFNPRTRTGRMVRTILFTLVALALSGFLFAWSGLYSIAASRGHWAVVEWALTFGMHSSVRTHALGVSVPPLDGPDLSALGAAHFHSGCAYCHGAPGVPMSPIARNMLPPPPDLSTATSQWRDRELFWIVKHGIKYTGMPAWVAQQRDDEVWAVVAFLKRLPNLDAAAYRDIAVGDLWIPTQTGRQIATTEANADAVSACARCHGADKRGPVSRLVPILHGQPVEFLTAALENYANGRRASGIMQSVANDLLPDGLKRVAAYYAGLTPPRTPATPPADIASRERGRTLAERGDASGKVPACGGCHGATSLNLYPRLAGQNVAYMANRLRLWKGGFASATAADTIMAPIARSLTDRQIDDVSAYFSSLSDSAASGKQSP
jgi:cytochrome c553